MQPNNLSVLAALPLTNIAASSLSYGGVMQELITDNFSRVWPVHVSNLTTHLIEARKAVGDLDLFIVLAVVGDRTLSERRTEKSLTYTQLIQERQCIPAPEDINLQSISDFTGIPKETVRRKLKELQERGWIEKNEKGYFRATARCAQELEALTMNGVKYLSNMFELFTQLRGMAPLTGQV